MGSHREGESCPLGTCKRKCFRPVLENHRRVVFLEGQAETGENPYVRRSNAYFLKTARLGFRRWSTDDLPLAVALGGDPEVTRFIGGPFSQDEIKERLGREIASMSAYHVQYWPFYLLINDEHVGCGGLRP